MVLKYKDFGSAGNILNIIITINNKIKFKKKYRNIILYRNYYIEINYATYKSGKILFAVIEKINEPKSYYLVIHDLTILDIE